MSVSERLFCRSAPWRWTARRLVLPWALQGVEPSGMVLELGGGNGAMVEGAMRRFPDARVVLTDVDPAMLAGTRQRLALRGEVAVAAADATRLPFRDGTLDVVTSHLMLHHVIDWERAVAEAGRVLRPGGLLVGYDLVQTRLAEWVHRADRSPHRLIPHGKLEVALTAAGMEAVAVRYSMRRHLQQFTARKPLGSADPAPRSAATS